MPRQRVSNQRLPGLPPRLTRPVFGLTLLSYVITTAYPVAAVPSLAPAPSGAPAQTTAPSPVEEPYILGAGDRVRIDIFQVPQYSGEFDVLIDGTLNLPLVSPPIPVQGLTIREATDVISAAYNQYLRRPIVTLTLLSRRPLQVGVAGEVLRPGSYALPQDGAQFPTLTQVLQLAGGVTQSADVRQVQLRRPNLLAGGEEVINVDLWELIRTGNLGYDITLRDGDSVFIPTTTVDLAESPILAAASFAASANQPINIAVVGEVFRPGTYTVTGGSGQTGAAGDQGGVNRAESPPTVTRAIQLAGGIKPYANIRQVEIRRLTRTGEEQKFEVDLWALLQGDLRQDAILQEGDTIVIPEADTLTAQDASTIASASFSPDVIQVNVVGEVDSPGTVSLPPNSTLNQAVLAAGGFNNRANDEVDLVRLNPDGTVSRIEVDVNFSEGIDAAGNPILQNNDVIIVGRSGLASLSDTLGTILTPLGSVFSIFELPARFLRLFD